MATGVTQWGSVRESDREGRRENRGNHMDKQVPMFEEAGSSCDLAPGGLAPSSKEVLWKGDT